VDVPAFQLPPELADADTVGVIYDEIDGLSFYNEYKVLPRRVTPRAERPSSLRAALAAAGPRPVTGVVL